MHYRLLFTVAALLTISKPLFAQECSWVGSDDGCRNKPVGSFCTNGETAGVCATYQWDHCKCVAGAAATPAEEAKEAKDEKTCSWVGSDDGCRDKAVGSVCANGDAAGVCGTYQWEQCKCVSAPTHAPHKKKSKRREGK